MRKMIPFLTKVQIKAVETSGDVAQLTLLFFIKKVVLIFITCQTSRFILAVKTSCHTLLTQAIFIHEEGFITSVASC